MTRTPPRAHCKTTQTDSISAKYRSRTPSLSLPEKAVIDSHYRLRSVGRPLGSPPVISSSPKMPVGNFAIPFLRTGFTWLVLDIENLHHYDRAGRSTKRETGIEISPPQPLIFDHQKDTWLTSQYRTGEWLQSLIAHTRKAQASQNGTEMPAGPKPLIRVRRFRRRS